MNLRLRIALTVLLVGILIVTGSYLFRDPEPRAHRSDSDQGGMVTLPHRWTSSEQCKTCHEEVYREWEGSHHQIAYLNPEVRKLSDDFRNKECQACHLPQPVSHTGFLRRVLPRMTQPNEGVSCLTCHLSESGGIMARNDRPTAPCRPKRDDRFLSVQLCASCHNQHKTTDQWAASHYANNAITCNSCHMPAAARAASRSGFDHRYLGAHDATTLRRAGRLEAHLDGTTLQVALTNVGAGHHFPTEERHRAVDIVYRLQSESDAWTKWERIYRFRWPYRDEPGENTQLPAGQRKEISIQVPASTKEVEVALWYALQPYVPLGHEQTTLLHSLTLAPGEAKQSPTDGFVPLPRPTSLPASQPARQVDDDVLTALRSFVANAGKPLSDKERANLEDLWQTGFHNAAGNARVAHRARRALLEHADAHWLFESLLADEDPATRRQAAILLAEIQARVSVPVLIYRLKYEADPVVLLAVISSLQQLGNRSGYAKLEAMLSADSTAAAAASVARRLLQALGTKLPDTLSHQDLARLLRQHAGQRLATSTSQPQATDQSTTQRGERLLDARIAQHVIAMSGFELRPVDDARFILQAMGGRAVTTLAQGVTSDNPYVRTHCLEVLHDMGPTALASQNVLLPLLDQRPVSPRVVRTLGRIGAKGARAKVRALLDDAEDELRMAAAEALGHLGDPQDLETLLAIMADPRNAMDVRVRAAYGAALLAPASAGRQFLVERRQRRDYHPPTIAELLDRVPGD